jgi:Fe-S cluster assembly ATPase SufC
MVKFNVRPFDWSSVKANRIFALFGRRGSGKSTVSETNIACMPSKTMMI